MLAVQACQGRHEQNLWKTSRNARVCEEGSSTRSGWRAFAQRGPSEAAAKPVRGIFMLFTCNHSDLYTHIPYKYLLGHWVSYTILAKYHVDSLTVRFPRSLRDGEDVRNG